MVPVEGKSKHVGLSLEELNILDNKVAIALARHDEIVNGWMKASNRPPKPPVITDEEIEAQILVNSGVSAGGETSTKSRKHSTALGTKSLHAKLLPSKTLKASKARNAEEKAASARRGLRDQSSDEEEGRSGLGRAKRRKAEPGQRSVPSPSPQHTNSDQGSQLTFRDAQQVEGDSQVPVSEARSGDSKKPKPKPTAEAPVKKAKLQEKTGAIASSPGAGAEMRDSTDTATKSDPLSQRCSSPLSVEEISSKTEHHKSEAKRLKKRLKREKRKRLLREGAAQTLKG